jgi:hypothetical protein
MRRLLPTVLVALGLVTVAAGCSDSMPAAVTATSALPVGTLSGDGATVAIGGTTSLPTTAPSADPATTAPAEVQVPAGCDVPGDVAVIDRDNQRAWTCTDGVLTREFPASTAWSQPDAGTYEVYAKDAVTWSKFGGQTTTLNKFVAFSYGKQTGARIAFHAIPVTGDGSLVQPVESVGELARRGESAGCIRLRPDDAEWMWEMLDVGEAVIVLN